MNSFTVEILDDEGAKCKIFTVRKEGASLSETEKFFNKRTTSLKALNTNFQELSILITQVIANEDGALPEYFRDEREAHGLPKGEMDLDDGVVTFANFPLRLYCLRISNEILILFNGDEKTSWAGQAGKTRTTFLEAQLFAEKIKEALNEGYIDFEKDENFIP
jgi:hypothetical protein